MFLVVVGPGLMKMRLMKMGQVKMRQVKMQRKRMAALPALSLGRWRGAIGRVLRSAETRHTVSSGRRLLSQIHAVRRRL